MQKYMFKMKETLKHLRRVALSIRNGQGSHCSDFLLPSVLSAFLGFSSLFLVTYSTAALSVGWVRSVWGTANLHVSSKKKKNKKKPCNDFYNST